MKRKTTKKELLLSFVAMFLCIAMLIGTTFSWFTDTASSGVNRIVAGNLDILFEYSTDGVTWKEVKPDSTDIFGTDNLWEPGYARIAYLRISNAGSLALKYSLIVDQYQETPGINQNGDEFLLSDYLQIGTIDNRTSPFESTEKAIAIAAAQSMKPMANYQKTGSLLPGQTNSMAMIIYMPETVGNEANHDGIHIPEISFRLHLYATQYTWESDSFGNDYDLGAQLPALPKIVVQNIQTKTKTAEPVTIEFPENAPETGNTIVTFPAGSFAQDDAVLNLFAETRNQTAANPNFEIDSTGTGTIAGIQLTATVGETAITDFNGQYVTVTTYIEKNLNVADIKLYYVDNSGTRIESSMSGGDFEIVSYDPATGKFVFRTKHFSRYEVDVPFVEKVSDDFFNIINLRGLFVMANDINGQNTYRLMDKEGKDIFNFIAHDYSDELQRLAEKGIRLEVKGNVILDTNHFRINLFNVPLAVAKNGILTIKGGANINVATHDSLKGSQGTIRVQGGNYIGCDPAELDSSLTEPDSEYIAVSYTKDGILQFFVGARDSTFVYGAPNTEYAPVHDNYTITMLANNGLYSVYSNPIVKNAPKPVTVCLLPGNYYSETTVYVYSSVDTVGLGDKECIIVEKKSSSDSNRHLFNLSNRDTVGYDYMTLRNMKLIVSSNTTGGKDNGAIQVIGQTKAKCYDLIIQKTAVTGRPIYVNGNNANNADGKIYRAYAYFENVVIVRNSSSIFETNGTVTIRHHNLTYDNGNKTYNSSIKGFLDYTVWDW